MLLEFEQENGNSDYGTAFSNNSVWVYNQQQPIYLNGKLLSIDQRQSEEEIIESLVWVRDILFDVFGRSFDSVEVVFDYGRTHEYGAENIDVYYYDKTDDIRIGDYIYLNFDNYANSSSETESADIITNCSIKYYSYRKPMSEAFSVEAKCKLISLEEAEELLENGYVFGGHSCSLCMAAQEKVSFAEYDYVSFEYVSDYYGYGEPARAIPFYAFYKKIGKADNGNIIYAKTYVCAVEVSGLEEYFKAQESNHNR